MTLQAQIKWVTNIADFKKAIEDGTTGIVAHTAKVDQLTRSLSGNGLLGAANNYVAAVEKMGGVEKLTAAEKDRINTLLVKALDKYEALGRTAPAAMLQLADATKKVEQPTSAVHDTLGELGTQIKATALGFLSAQAIIGGVQTAFRSLSDFIGGSIQSYASAEAAAKKMTVALQSQGTATPAVVKQFNDLATQFQRTTVYSDDLINEMEALLTQVGNVAPGQMQKALQASADLASGLGIDLQSATMLVAKAFAGGGDELGRLKAILGEAYRPGMDMAQVLDVIQSKFGGQAQSEAETYAGKVKQLANEWDNFKESVGRAIVEDPALQALLGHLRDGVTGAGEAAGEYAPTISDYWVRWTTNSQTLQLVVGWLNATEQAFRSLDEQVSHMKPVTPKQFMPEGDPFAALWASAKKTSDDLVATWKKQGEAADQLAAAMNASFRKWSGAETAEQMRILDGTFRRMADSGHITEAQVRAMAAEAAKLSKEGAILSPRLWDIVMATGALNPEVKEGVQGLGQLGEKFDVTVPKASALATSLSKIDLGIENIIAHIPKMDLGYQFDRAKPKVYDLGKALNETLDSIPGTLAAALTGGGGIGGALKAIASKVGANIGGAVGFAFGGPFGQKVGEAIGSLAGPLVGLFGKLFGTAGRDAVVDFAKSFGGFDTLQAKLETLGAAGAALWVKLTQGVGRNNPEQAKKVIEEINAAFAAQDAWMSRLPGLIEKYGLSWEQAGQQAKQAHLDEIAQGLIRDFADLSKAGFDVTLITEKMGTAINDYVHLAMQTGTEIPAAMKPLLEKMIEMGTLTDLNGDKITDLEGSGISFAKTLTQGFQSIVDAIHELTKALGGVPTRIDVDTYYHEHGKPPGGDTDPTGAEQFHSGTSNVRPFVIAHRGLLPDEVPAILQTGEAVLNRRAAAAVGTHAISELNAGRRGGGGSVTVEKGAIVVNGAQDPERVAEEIMRRLRREMRLNVA